MQEHKIERYSDFNDLMLLGGISEVKRQIEAALFYDGKTTKERTEDAKDGMEDDESGIKPVNNKFYKYPDETDKGKRFGTIENTKELIRRLNATVRYNVVSKRVDMIIPGCEFSMDNQANAALSEFYSACARERIPSEKLKQYILRIADSNQYNPVATWIESKPWDKQSRMRDFYDTIKSTNEELKIKLIRHWMISAVAAAFEPHGVSAHGVLVLRGKQYLGKTAWFKALAPKDMNVLFEGAFLKPDDKDSVYQALSHWIVELGELDATFKRSDISQLKAFITKSRDILRRPYAELESEFPRRTVFFGSVNENDFLKDPTGNRRFWTIDCEAIDYAHHIDMQQVWAEVKETMYDADEQWWLPVENIKELNEHNEQFESKEPIEERIHTELNWESKSREWKTATEICQLLGMTNPTQRDTRAAASAMRKRGVEMHRSKGMLKFGTPDKKYNTQL